MLIEKELNEAGTRLLHLRENKRILRLKSEIAEAQKNIDAIDMDEAARAKRNFEEKYSIEKKKEEDAGDKVRRLFDSVKERNQSLIAPQQVAAIGGQLEASKGQVKHLESDLKEYKGINQKYTDQLIKVKVEFLSWINIQST